MWIHKIAHKPNNSAMENNDRRQFLKKSMIGISGAALLPAHMSLAANNTGQSGLPARLLGKTGINTPLISIGAGNVTSTGIVRAAYDAGIKLFFSATYYGEGNNEILVGESLKGLPRDSYVIGTAAIPTEIDKKTGLLTSDFTAESYLKKVEGSLKRFGLDYIDIVLLPFAAKKETVQHEGVLNAFEKAKKQGKIRFVGIASHGGTVEALNAAAEAGMYDVAMISYNFKIQNLEALNGSIANAVNAGIGIMAMKTTAGVSRDKSGPALNSDAVIKWALQNKNISSVISGMTTVDQLHKNLSMINNLKMTDQELRDLNLAGLNMGPTLYCQQCQKCLPQCPHNLDIPTVMRSYMYAYGYKNPEQAWHTLTEAGLATNVCDRCDVCRVNCAAGFDVKAKITDIARLKDVPLDFLRV
jgi:predicted aldo/keto reductase-like oxidoreductase